MGYPLNLLGPLDENIDLLEKTEYAVLENLSKFRLLINIKI